MAWTLGLLLSAVLWESLLLLLRLYARRRLEAGQVCTSMRPGRLTAVILLCRLMCNRLQAKSPQSELLERSLFYLCANRFCRSADAWTASLVEMSPSLVQEQGPLPAAGPAPDSQQLPSPTAADTVSVEEVSMMQIQAAYDEAIGNVAVPLPRADDSAAQEQVLMAIPAAPADEENVNPLLSSVFQGMSRLVDHFTSGLSPVAPPREP